MSRINLSPPHMGSEELKLIHEAFATNWIAPIGPHVDAFEKELASLVQIPAALAVNSGTAAIHLALRLAGVGKGDIVFCSSLTFAASATPILYQGAVPVFIDSDAETWNLSTVALKRALEKHAANGKPPKALVVVNLYGQSADLNPILKLCREYGVKVIEDAAESLGATYDGKPSGTLGDFGIYSFNGNKIITTSGGGMLISRDQAAINKARFWSTQARDPAIHYQHSELGYNYRLSNVLAAIGRGQLKALDERVAARRLVFDRYRKNLESIDGLDFMPEASYGMSTRWLTTLTVEPKRFPGARDRALQLLAEDNIEARPVWKPLHLQPLFEKCEYFAHEPGNSVSERLFDTGLCLPSGSNLSIEDQARVIRGVFRALEN